MISNLSRELVPDDSGAILMEQLPDWFKPVLEYIALMKAYGVELDQLSGDCLQIYDNLFIQTCDEKTLRYWEKLFGITIRYGDTIDFRRQRLIQLFSQIVPYTVFDLRDRLTDLYGDDYELSVDVENCTITIKVTSDRYGAVDLLYDLIWSIVPAHLRVIANQETRTYIESAANVGAFCATTYVQTI